MHFIANDALAGRIMVCRGGEPSHLLPLTTGRPHYQSWHGGQAIGSRMAGVTVSGGQSAASHGALPVACGFCA